MKFCLLSVSSDIKILIKIVWNGEINFTTTSDRHDTVPSDLLTHYPSQAPAPDEKNRNQFLFFAVVSCCTMSMVCLTLYLQHEPTNQPTLDTDARSGYKIGEKDQFILW